MRRAASLVVVVLALVRGLNLTAAPFTDWTHDEVYYIALAFQQEDRGLYPRDALFQEFRRAIPAAYPAFVEGAIRLVGSPEMALRVVPTVLLTIYLLGLSLLVRRLTGSVAAGLASALVASHTWPTPFLLGVGIEPGRLFPRDTTTALLPWLLLLLERGHARLPFLLASLLVFLHPISTPQVFVVLLAWRFSRSTGPGAGVRDLLRDLPLFAICALPFAAVLLRLPDRSPPPLELVRLRMPYALPPPAIDVARFLFVHLLPLALIGGVGLAAGRFVGGGRRPLLALIVAAGGISLLGAATGGVAELRPFQPIRAVQYLYLPLFVGTGALLARAVASRRLAATALALAAVVVLSRPAHSIGLLGGIAARAGLGERPTNFLLQTDPETMRAVLAASCVDMGGGRSDFIELARFARERTDRADLFLLPPVGLDHWRVHALRGAFVTWKDGGVITLSRRYAELWHERFERVVRLYASHDAQGFGEMLASGDVQFVVCDARRPRLELPVAFENARYVAYGPGARPSLADAR
jgi:hypothetical protein